MGKNGKQKHHPVDFFSFYKFKSLQEGDQETNKRMEKSLKKMVGKFEVNEMINIELMYKLTPKGISTITEPTNTAVDIL